MVDAEEEGLERAGCTIAVQVLQSPYHGLEHLIHELIPFDAPTLLCGGPSLLPIIVVGLLLAPRITTTMSRKSDIREAKNLYAEDEKDLRLEYHF
jgi:hypothetical protein